MLKAAAALILALAASAAAVPGTVELIILGTTDLHGHIYPTTYFKPGQEEALGLARVATLIKQERAANRHVLLFDSGDLLQGSPLTAWFAAHGTPALVHPMIASFNALGYTAWAVGNHDFDYGLPLLDKARRDARFPFLAANIYKAGTREPAFEPYLLKEIGGVKVGIIGTAPPGIALWARRHVESKLEVGDAVAALKAGAKELKARGADLVVGIPHTGFGGDGPLGPTFAGYGADAGLPPEQVGGRLAEEVPELDALLLGHSHQAVSSEIAGDRTVVMGANFGKQASASVSRPVAIAQAGFWGMHLAKVRFQLERRAERWVVAGRHVELLSTRGVTPDPDILALNREAHEATLAYVNAPVAATAEPWDARLSRLQDTPLVDLINHVQLERTGAQLSAAASFDVDAGLAAGPIAIAQVAALYPYDNALVAVRITGKQLRAYLERAARYYAPYAPGAGAIDREQPGFNYDMIAGIDYAIDVTRPAGSRVTDLRYKRCPVGDDATFTLALNSFRQQGGGGYEMLRDAPVVYNHDENIRDLIIEYLKTKRTVQPGDVYKRNWRLIPEGAVDATTLLYRAH